MYLFVVGSSVNVMHKEGKTWKKITHCPTNVSSKAGFYKQKDEVPGPKLRLLATSLSKYLAWQ